MEDYDSTNVYQLRNSYCTAVNSNAGTLYRYEICLSDKDGKLIPYNNTSNATTTYTKTLNSTPFDPFGPIFYYNSTTTKNAGEIPGTDTLYTHLTFDCRRALNIQSDGTAGTTALTANQPVYIKATYDASTGLATLINNTSATSYLDRSSIVQAFPNADITNCILVYLGLAVSKYQIELSITHPVYKWDSAKSKWMEFSCIAENAATVNGHSVEIDIPPTAKLTDTNTTYTFANGTNGFSVTPSGWTAQTVTVTPSITNNVTGSGTSGYLTKFNGANTITNGPQLGSSTSTYLRNDATWQNPQNVYVGNSAPSGPNYQVWIDTNGADDFTAIINAVYPVNSIYISVSATNPATIFGVGTWVAWGSGRVPVGVNTSDSDFNTVEKTGGGKKIIIPFQNYTSFVDFRWENIKTWSNWENKRRSYNATVGDLSGEASYGGAVGSNENGEATNGNLQPYITCYMWKRTA